MKALFIELLTFSKYRADYLTDDQFGEFQQMLMQNPQWGDVIPHTGGLRKVRFKDERRQKGKRGGIRVLYYFWTDENTFYLFTLYDKDTLDDLSQHERDMFSQALNLIKRGNKS